jgi:hypothetical protein
MGERMPTEEPQKSLSDIVMVVKNRFIDALEDDDTGFKDCHPRTLISMVVTNILVNLMFHRVAVTDIKKRIKLVEDVLDEVKEMTLELWNALEAGAADETNAH